MKHVIPKLFKQYTWIVSLILVAWASISPVGSVSAKSHRVKIQPVVKVGVYNYAGVPRLELGAAEHQAAALLAGACVRIEWVDYLQKRRPGQSPPEISSTDFCLRILPGHMAARCNYKPCAMGESIIPPQARRVFPSGYADVFYGRVEHFSTVWGLFPGEVLGDAIAHELGHLLLGPRHSRQGIMKAHWTLRDLQLASRRRLCFSPRQVAALQRAARSLHQDTPPTTLARR
jgi:hypothetical protein